MTASRHSRQRDILTDILKSTKSHPSADAVYQSARNLIPNISLGTVYRNLAKLCENGTVRRLDLGKGGDRYDGDTSVHAHFVCEKCGKITDIAYDFSKDVLRRAEEFTDGDATSCDVTVYGVCHACRASDKPFEDNGQ